MFRAVSSRLSLAGRTVELPLSLEPPANSLSAKAGDSAPRTGAPTTANGSVAADGSSYASWANTLFANAAPLLGATYSQTIMEPARTATAQQVNQNQPSSSSNQQPGQGGDGNNGKPNPNDGNIGNPNPNGGSDKGSNDPPPPGGQGPNGGPPSPGGQGPNGPPPTPTPPGSNAPPPSPINPFG